MELVKNEVVSSISAEIPDVIGIIFDGWSSGSTYYVGIFAVYELNDLIKKPLLAVSALNSMDADSHIKLFDETIRNYGKPMSCIKFVVGDNCSTNRSIAPKMGVPLVGCASHRLNLAVKKYLSNHEPLLNKIDKLMSALSTKNIGQRLKNLLPCVL
jgi:hypothetical protein